MCDYTKGESSYTLEDLGELSLTIIQGLPLL